VTIGREAYTASARREYGSISQPRWRGQAAGLPERGETSYSLTAILAVAACLTHIQHTTSQLRFPSTYSVLTLPTATLTNLLPSVPTFAPPVANPLMQVKKIEAKDAVMTNAQQIHRLTKPASKYLNLNPYEVRSIICTGWSLLTPLCNKLVHSISSSPPRELLCGGCG
jgi:hypothetical protein